MINRAAKAARLDLKVKAESFDTAFGRAKPFEDARSDGFRRARQRAGRALGREFAKATFEAAADGDLTHVDAEKARLQAHLEASQDRFAKAASIRAMQDAIFMLYRQRDAARRRRVDRAFRTAGLVRRRGYIRRAFQLAAGATLLTGAGLSMALGVGAFAAGAALIHRRRAYPNAQKVAAQARDERREDLNASRRASAVLSGLNNKLVPSKRESSEKAAPFNATSAEAPHIDSVPTPLPRFSFDRIEKADRTLVGFYVQLIQSRKRPDIVRALDAALGGELAGDVKAFLANASRNEVALMCSWFRETKPMLQAAFAALHRRSAPATARAVWAYVIGRMNAGIGV